MAQAHTAVALTAPFALYQTVRARIALSSDEGSIPVGAEGTIVDLCETPGYVIVEFINPIHAIMTVQHHQILE